MILSYAQLENIAAATTKDFNNFFFGTSMFLSQDYPLTVHFAV